MTEEDKPQDQGNQTPPVNVTTLMDVVTGAANLPDKGPDDINDLLKQFGAKSSTSQTQR